MLRKTLTGWVVALGAVLIMTVQARADFFEDFTIAMNRAGFAQGINYNYIAGGWTYEFYQYFNDKEYDFGNSELTLNGALRGEVNYTTRGIPEIEFNLSTPSGLTYDYLATDGVNKFTIDNGYLNIDQKISINKYGGYNIELKIDNIAKLVSDSPEGGELDLTKTIGPINIHGHWLVDVVNLTFGRWCGFMLPGGGLDQLALDWNGLLDNQISDAIAEMKAAENAPAAGKLMMVPEPISMLLLVIGGGMIVGRRR
jgi:hypothetical protein